MSSEYLFKPASTAGSFSRSGSTFIDPPCTPHVFQHISSSRHAFSFVSFPRFVSYHSSFRVPPELTRPTPQLASMYPSNVSTYIFSLLPSSRLFFYGSHHVVSCRPIDLPPFASLLVIPCLIIKFSIISVVPSPLLSRCSGR